MATENNEINNLEGIAFEDVKNQKGESYAIFRKNLKPKYWMVWRDIFIGYLLMIASLGLVFYMESMLVLSIPQKILLVLAGAFLTAFWLAFIQLFIHEAAHYNIHPNKKSNDTLANIFIGVMLGIHIVPYRKTHWKHHQRLGHSDDTENSYFNPLSMVHLLKMITGIHAVSILLNRNKMENAQNQDSLRKQKVNLVIGGLLNLAFLIILAYFGYYLTAITWILTVWVFYPFFGGLRQMLEHRDQKYVGSKAHFFKQDHGKLSRLFKPGPFSFFIGGAGFNRHMIHHWDPQISYTNLKEVESFLLDTDRCREIIVDSRTTYFKTFISLVEI